jgi:hypothetical protein
VTPEDIAVVRRIITARRAAGWRQIVFGIRADHEHLYWAPGDFRQSAKVICGNGLIEHKAPGEALPGATLRPHNAAEVEAWLTLLGLLLPAEVTT